MELGIKEALTLITFYFRSRMSLTSFFTVPNLFLTELILTDQ